MTALTQERFTTKRQNTHHHDPVLAGAVIYAGAIVVLTATGFARNGNASATVVARGVATFTVDNSAGANGDVSVETETGVFLFDNSAAADEITRAEIGDDCFIADDQTVAKTDGAATRSVAGVIRDVTADGVFVEIGT